MLKHIAGVAILFAGFWIGSSAHAASSSALVNLQTGQCVDVVGYSTVPGGPTQQYMCTGTGNQLWETQVISFGNDGSPVVRFVSVGSGLCLDIASGSNGAAVIQNTCNGVASQNWVVGAPYVNTLVANSIVSQVVVARAVKNVATGLCLDAAASGGNTGVVQQWTCGNVNNQRWFVNIF